MPTGCVNAAFIGNFAETPRGTVFTTEYSVRTAMEAVYTLLDIDRGVPEVFGSASAVRVLLDATARMMDEEKLTDLHLPLIARLLVNAAAKKVDHSRILQLLTEHGLL